MIAEEQLRGTLSSDKNELLFSQFGINYNNEPALYRKGSIVMKKWMDINKVGDLEKPEAIPQKTLVTITLHEDLIGDQFWNENDHLLREDKLKKVVKKEKRQRNYSMASTLSELEDSTAVKTQ